MKQYAVTGMKLLMRGLDPLIHRKHESIQWMDRRVKPGDDDRWIARKHRR